MSIDFFWKGLLIGLSIAAPVGPIGLLCIQRTLAYGTFSGFISGMGAATADAVYGSIAAFGLEMISQFLLAQEMWVRLIGGVLLLGLGIRGVFLAPAKMAATAKSRGLIWHYVSTLTLTIANPMTILSFIAVFAAIGVTGTTSAFFSSLKVVIGVFIGSALWWGALAFGVTFIKKSLNDRVIHWIRISSSLLIIGFGVYGVVSSGML